MFNEWYICKKWYVLLFLNRSVFISMLFLPIFRLAVDMYLPVPIMPMRLWRNTEYAEGFFLLCVAYSGVIPFIRVATIRSPRKVSIEGF